MKQAMIVPAFDGRPNCHLDCHNYEALMCDLESAIEELLRLGHHETTHERALLWVRSNWPSLYRGRKEDA